MSLTVTHINSDTTFLLSFSPDTPAVSSSLPPPHSPNPSATSSQPPDGISPPGTFTILIDPWIDGVSQIIHPKIFSARHRVAACIKDLSELPEPNLVIISQAQTDHCHEDTLRQLDPTSPITTILAEASAAKKIRKMNHFPPDMVHTLRPYSPKKADNIIRFCIPPIVFGGTPGEVTIAFIQPKVDLSAIHNAIGITYLPPSTSSNSIHSHMPFHVDNPYSSTTFPITPPETPYTAETCSPYSLSDATSYFPNSLTFSSHSQNQMSVSSSIRSLNGTTRKSRCLSLIYSPHGLPYPPVHAYATSHLMQNAALPLTALLHPFVRSTNPWYLGGNVITGTPGGAQIAGNLQARKWIGAHDGDKEVTGFTTTSLDIQRFSPSQISDQIRGNTELINLDIGASCVVVP